MVHLETLLAGNRRETARFSAPSFQSSLQSVQQLLLGLLLYVVFASGVVALGKKIKRRLDVRIVKTCLFDVLIVTIVIKSRVSFAKII
jgi:hypothetical protein